ncbi:hypothetical protein [Sphingomonas sp.]|uniref:hypothetical protein n=1 Tax=Sphingomonas sp. TaxID=28214 RepID=UPI002DE3411D|nr:hypothetical protein [Sphingomonas sp.]
MTVQTETSVNGGLLLRSVYRVYEGVPSLQVFAPRVGEMVPGQAAGNTARASQGTVSINFDRQNGISIARQVALPTGSVKVGASGTPTESGDTLPPLDLASGPVETAGGRVSVSELPQGIRSRIEGDGIDASHLFGAAFGSVVANTANERSIDSSTTIAVDLRGATAMNLGSALLRAEAIGAETVRRLVVR